MKIYKVELKAEEKQRLEKLISSGVASARKLMRARILLKMNAGMKKAEISQALDVSINTVTNVCRVFQSQGIEAVEHKRPDREYGHSLDGEAGAYLIAIACSEPPEGRERWTLRMLKTEMVNRKYVDNVSHETIRTALKKTNLNLARNSLHS